MFTFGGTPADVLTDTAGNAVPNYPLVVRVAGTGQAVTALYELNGTPIGQLRTNPASHPAPGAIRAFQADIQAIDYEYLDTSGSPVRWYQAGRELAQTALDTAQAVAAAQLDTADVQAIIDSRGGVPNGLAQLGADGLVPVDQLPDNRTVVVGDDGRHYRLLSAVIRNTGDGWGLINDASHQPSGITSVETQSDRLILQHGVGAAKVSSLQVTPDEWWAARGLRCGASVGLTSTSVFLYRDPSDRISDEVYYSTTTSTWTSAAGVFSGFAFSGGILTLTHEDMGTTGATAAIAQRGPVGAFAGNLAATTTQVVFYNGAFGALTAATTPVNGMRCYLTRHGRRATVPAASPASVVAASGNLWITGLLEIP
ncbi:hypothetical protein [Streptomyces sp. NPDC102283]|uniref:hypothetical protein n=1 Tax=Streptomyces sp. NPDC102283 TaxID=3366155 RepID=UPI00381E4C67